MHRNETLISIAALLLYAVVLVSCSERGTENEPGSKVSGDTISIGVADVGIIGSGRYTGNFELRLWIKNRGDGPFVFDAIKCRVQTEGGDTRTSIRVKTPQTGVSFSFRDEHDPQSWARHGGLVSQLLGSGERVNLSFILGSYGDARSLAGSVDIEVFRGNRTIRKQHARF